MMGAVQVRDPAHRVMEGGDPLLLSCQVPIPVLLPCLETPSWGTGWHLLPHQLFPGFGVFSFQSGQGCVLRICEGMRTSSSFPWEIRAWLHLQPLAPCEGGQRDGLDIPQKGFEQTVGQLSAVAQSSARGRWASPTSEEGEGHPFPQSGSPPSSLTPSIRVLGLTSHR